MTSLFPSCLSTAGRKMSAMISATITANLVVPVAPEIVGSLALMTENPKSQSGIRTKTEE